MQTTSILFFGWFFYPKTGGAESIMLNQARELVKRGYTVSVLTSVLEDGEETEEELFGIRIFRRSFVNSGKPQSFDHIKNSLLPILDRVKPDIVHFHNGSYPSGSKTKSVGAGTISHIFNIIKDLEIKIIEHAHNAQLKGADETKVLRELPWDYVICVSQFVQDEWKKLGTNAKMISVVYNGIDLEHFADAEPAIDMQSLREPGIVVLLFPARITSLTTGELNAQKNIVLVLDALQALQEQKIENFKFVGISNTITDQGTVADNAVEAVAERGLAEKTTLLPTINPSDMPSYYAGADVLVVPATNETFGLMYVEAMAAGKVVIATETGGPKEYIRNEENGFFVDPKSPQELADILKKLLKDASLREKIGKQAQIDVQRFSIESMVDGVVGVYEDVLA